MWFTTLVFALFAVLLTWMLWKRWKYDLHKIPSPPGVPVLGHVLGIVKTGEFTKYNSRSWKKLGCPKMMKVTNSHKKVLKAEAGRCVCSCN